MCPLSDWGWCPGVLGTLIPMPRRVRSPVLRICNIQTALNTSTHSHTRDSMQAGDSSPCRPVLPPLLNHSCLEPQSHSVAVSQTVCLHSLPGLSRSLHTSLLCCHHVCSPPRFLLLTMAAPSSGPGEMQPLGKRHWVDSSTQYK